MVDFLWPPACPLCLRGTADVLCDDCRAQVAVLAEEERSVAIVGVDAAFACVPYEEPLRRLLVQAKYGRNPHPLTALARLLDERLPGPECIGQPDLVVPIPLSRARRRRRGYDQVAPLAQAVGKRLGRPVRSCLVRRSGGDSQAGLSRTARRRNLKGRFRARPVAGRAVLLIDDVVTTGATLEAAAAALRAAGARTIIALCLFKTREGAPGAPAGTRSRNDRGADGTV